MEQLLWFLAAATAVVIAATPWLLYQPVTRALRHEGVGRVQEVNVFGFYFPFRYMERRKHMLALEVERTLAKLKKVKAELEREDKRVKEQVELVNSLYASHVRDFATQRSWRNLWRLAPPLDPAYLKEMEKVAPKLTPSPKTTKYIPDAIVRKKGWSLDELEKSLGLPAGQRIMTWEDRTNPPRQQQQQGKRSQNQQQSQQQQQ